MLLANFHLQGVAAVVLRNVSKYKLKLSRSKLNRNQVEAEVCNIHATHDTKNLLADT